MTERNAFVSELRRARERRGLSLDAIAEQTKVSATLFAGLERGDLSRWPTGIFSRAFVRSYAAAVGLDPEATVAQFTRVFRDSAEEARPPKTLAFQKIVASNPSDAPARPAPAPGEAPGSRLVLDATRVAAVRARPATRLLRLLTCAIDAAIPGLAGGAAALAAGAAWFWPVAACAALTVHAVLYVLMGATPGSLLVARLAGGEAAPLPVEVERRRAGVPTGRRGHRHQPQRSAQIYRVRH